MIWILVSLPFLVCGTFVIWIAIGGFLTATSPGYRATAEDAFEVLLVFSMGIVLLAIGWRLVH